MRESTRDPDSLYLVVDPMLLLQTLHSLSLAAVATLLRTSTVEVPTFYNVAYKYSEFGSLMLALMLFVQSTTIWDYSVLTSTPYGLALAPRRSVTSCCSILQVYVACKSEFEDRPATN